MKKLLGITTALVGLTALAASAQASDPVKLSLGGYSYWYVGYASNDIRGTDYQEVDVKGDNEVWFDGSTKLDNGISVAVHIELEAGGGADQRTDVIDESYVTVSGGFGKLVVGTEDNAAALLHVSAPDVGLGLSDGDYGLWVVSPLTLEFYTTWADRDGDAEKIAYFTPEFHGLTFGISYTPNVASEDSRGATSIPTTSAHDAIALALGYTREFGAFTMATSAGYYRHSVDGFDATEEFTVGAKFGYAGWTLGGSFRHSEEDDRVNVSTGIGTGQNAIAGDGIAYDVGISYTSGPMAVSLGYFASDAYAITTGASDQEMRLIQLSGAYELGTGVTAVASVFYNEYDGGTNATQNEGVGFVSGLRLNF